MVRVDDDNGLSLCGVLFEQMPSSAAGSRASPLAFEYTTEALDVFRSLSSIKYIQSKTQLYTLYFC